jgi:L-asparaginase / beta-aspartyl-peptidase
MKGLLLLSATLLIIITTQFIDLKGNTDQNENRYVIVLHGGAGMTSSSIPDSLRDLYFNALSDALNIGKEILENGGSALDAVEKVVNYMEDNHHFNAGKGAVFTSAGTHELDASIMSGIDLSCGAVAGVMHVKNPVSLARLVMERSPHVLFGRDGAEEFGRQQGITFVENEYFHTPAQLKRWEEQNSIQIPGTVGCVALDMKGNLAAATSTGGMSGKMPGRIGDSPLVNAGTYANNKTCAVSATGKGELFIKNTIAYNISALMEYRDMTLEEASRIMIQERLPKESGGIIAVDKEGNYVTEFNTHSMFRGIADSKGKFEINIWR